VKTTERLALRGSKIFTPEEIETVESFPSVPDYLRAFVDPVLERKKGRVSRLWNDDIAERCEKTLRRKDVTVVFPEEERYPPFLKEIDPIPQVLLLKGDLSILSDPTLKIACVGSRKPSSYGKYAVQRIVKKLAEWKITIVSGLAYGIDVMSHLTALEQGAKTVGVLGFGVDHVYPASNTVVFKKVEEAGCLVSEYLPWQKPEVYFFPERNRIISGLSQGVLVIEASRTSGSLITVQFALSQNRDVFAVPGPIQSPLSEGTNGLIKKGAKLVTDAQDIIEEYPWIAQKNKTNGQSLLSSLDKEEKRVYELLLQGYHEFDHLIEGTQLRPSNLNQILTTLSLKGLVSNNGSAYFPLKEETS
jgi:DNA processing protein